MFRTSVVAVSLGLLTAAPALAQSPAPKTTDFSPQLLGTWEGPYQSEQAPPGGIKLVVAKEAGTWKVTLGVVADQPIDAAEVREFKVAGNEVSWIQDIMGMECKTLARLDTGTLKGGTECTQGGTVAITATFVLLKQ